MTFSQKVCFSDVNLNCLKCHNHLKPVLIIEFCILCNHLLKSLNSFILADFLKHEYSLSIDLAIGNIL